MALKLPAPEAAKIAIQSIGCGYDISLDLRLKYCKRDSTNPRLIEIPEDQGKEIVLPGGILIPNVSIAIKCDKGECTRFQSDVLSFQQVPSFVLIGELLHLLIPEIYYLHIYAYVKNILSNCICQISVFVPLMVI